MLDSPAYCHRKCNGQGFIIAKCDLWLTWWSSFYEPAEPQYLHQAIHVVVPRLEILNHMLGNHGVSCGLRWDCLWGLRTAWHIIAMTAAMLPCELAAVGFIIRALTSSIALVWCTRQSMSSCMSWPCEFRAFVASANVRFEITWWNEAASSSAIGNHASRVDLMSLNPSSNTVMTQVSFGRMVNIESEGSNILRLTSIWVRRSISTGYRMNGSVLNEPKRGTEGLRACILVNFSAAAEIWPCAIDSRLADKSYRTPRWRPLDIRTPWMFSSSALGRVRRLTSWCNRSGGKFPTDCLPRVVDICSCFPWATCRIAWRRINLRVSTSFVTGPVEVIKASLGLLFVSYQCLDGIDLDLTITLVGWIQQCYHQPYFQYSLYQQAREEKNIEPRPCIIRLDICLCGWGN